MPPGRLPVLARVAMTRADRGDGGAAATGQGEPGDRADYPDGLAPRPLLAGIHPFLLEIADYLEHREVRPPGEESCAVQVATFGALRPYIHKRVTGGRDRHLARDDEEFAAFAQASFGGLRHVGYLLTGDRHAAEDAAQAALVRTYAAWSRVRRDDAFAYSRRVLVNYLTDRWRRRLREYPTDDLPELPVGPDPADEVALRHWLTGALATLTVRERAVVVMRYLFDLPEATVARDLGISVGTVKSTSSRALAKLRVSADPAVPAPAIGGDKR